MAKKRRGGARPGAGRPKLEDARRVTFSVRVSEDDIELLREADAKSWARDVLVKAAKKRRRKS